MTVDQGVEVLKVVIAISGLVAGIIATFSKVLTWVNWRLDSEVTERRRATDAFIHYLEEHSAADREADARLFDLIEKSTERSEREHAALLEAIHRLASTA